VAPIFFYPSRQNVSIPQHVDQKRVKHVTHNNTTRNKECLLPLSSAAPFICCPLRLAESFSWRIRLSSFHAPLLFGWLLCCLVASLRLSADGSTSCPTLRLLVVAWRCIVMPVPLVVPPTILKALVVSPLIRAAAAACIVVVVAIRVVTIAPLASGVGGDGDGGLAIA
jgi:hypothetical protein